MSTTQTAIAQAVEPLRAAAIESAREAAIADYSAKGWGGGLAPAAA